MTASLIMVFVVETPTEIFWSTRKMDAQFKHLEFLYKNKAKYKEMNKVAFDKLVETTTKKVIVLEDDV